MKDFAWLAWKHMQSWITDSQISATELNFFFENHKTQQMKTGELICNESQNWTIFHGYFGFILYLIDFSQSPPQRITKYKSFVFVLIVASIYTSRKIGFVLFSTQSFNFGKYDHLCVYHSKFNICNPQLILQLFQFTIPRRFDGYG